MKKKSNYKKSRKLLAAVMVSAMLMSQSGFAAYAAEPTAITSVSSIIPDNITITDPRSLSEIELPGSQYGKLKWADGSLTADQRTQSVEVIFTPADGVDVSGLSGYDAASNTVRATITVVVTNISEEPAEETPVEEEPSGTEETEEGTEKLDESAVTEEAEEVSEEQSAQAPEENPAEDSQLENAENSKEETPADAEEDDSEVSSETPNEQDTKENAAADADEDGENKQEDSSQDSTNDETEDPSVTVTPTPVPDDTDNIFDQDITEKEDDRSDAAPEDLTEEEMLTLGEINHSYGGMCVMGSSLPWYVQFRVSDGSAYEFTNQAEAAIFQSYDFTLWDLREDTEYVVPDGEYISIMIPVKTGYKYTVEHILENGGTETIVPALEGNMLIFSTHSFSPFGIAGNNLVIGGTTPTPTPRPTRKPTATPTPTTRPSGGNSSSGGNSGNSSSTGNGSSTGSGSSTGNGSSYVNNGSSSSQTVTATPTPTSGDSEKTNAVKTGDTSPIIPLVIIAAAAVLIAVIAVVIKKKK